MTAKSNGKFNRREFLKQSTLATAAFAAGLGSTSGCRNSGRRQTSSARKKVIVIGMDGMDPGLCERLMNAGLMPNFDRLRRAGGYRKLGTSTPPQSPVAWANFINGAGPGSHGIFDFIHRNPQKQCAPFYAAAQTVPGQGYWEIGKHRVQLDSWPFNHKPSETLLRRQGVAFWDYLDKEGIDSVFYDLPSNYPPSPSKYGHHRCLSGMGTPDMLGTYGTYQHFSEDGPIRTKDEGGGKRSVIFFENETSKPSLTLIGPPDVFLKKAKPTTIEFVVHRDKQAKAAVIEIQDHKILLKEGQWSRWCKLKFELSKPGPNESINAICRFYLQEVAPNFRLYVSPINVDPSEPALRISEPQGFVEEISQKLGLFYTTGFQEDHKALSNKIFTDAEFAAQADYVLQERLNLLEYALENYDDGLLFFYFSSTDVQSHMFWWDSNEKHPTRSAEKAKEYFNHIKKLYQKMDVVLGGILKKYGDKATIIVMSDHGFANFKRQFSLNTWLRENGYIQPSNSTSILSDVDWSETRAYGLGINGLYLNLAGRERDGIVAAGEEREALLEELVSKLEAVRDVDGKPVVRKVYRKDKIYSGPDTYMAPDLIVGYYRGYRISWGSILGGMNEEVLSDNDSTWSADHCIDPEEVPGVIFSNRPIVAKSPSLIDVAPSILKELGLDIPVSMQGKNIF